MLPQKRATTAADLQRRAIHHQSDRHEEAGRGNAIHELHDNGRFQGREGEHQKESGDKLGPDKKRETHPGQTGRAQLNDGGDEVDRA